MTLAASASDTRSLALGPERALLASIPLGLGPSLHRLRGGSLRLVRRFPSYYGLVRLPAPVHHRLQLVAFPMRTLGASCHRPDAGYPSFRRDPSTRDVLFDPGRVNRPSHNGTVHVAFGSKGMPPPPAIRVFRGSITHPTQQLCTLRGRRYLRLTQHSPPGGSLCLTWAGLSPADCASLLAPSLCPPLYGEPIVKPIFKSLCVHSDLPHGFGLLGQFLCST